MPDKNDSENYIDHDIVYSHFDRREDAHSLIGDVFIKLKAAVF